jgi:glyoxylate reductase
MAEQKKVRVFATCDIGRDALQVLKDRGYEVEVYDKIDPPPKELIVEKVASRIDALITTLRDKIDREVLEAGKGTLKVVAQIAVGFDNIDRAAANELKIPFTNTAEVLTEATAEFAFFLMGSASRKLYPSERLVREKKWGSWHWHPYDPFLGDEVTGKTVSVIGTGRIGKAFIKKCVGLDMNIFCHDPFVEDPDFVRIVQEMMDVRFTMGFSPERRTIQYASLEDALRQGDYISLHVPLLRPGESDKPTYHLISDKAFELMKPTAYLINTSRGPVVDEAALYRALKSRKIRGASLDVFEKEPLPADSPLLESDLEECVRVYHHFASGTYETRLSVDPNKGMAGRCVQGLLDVIERNYGGDITKMPYVVNKEAFR